MVTEYSFTSIKMIMTFTVFICFTFFFGVADICSWVILFFDEELLDLYVLLYETIIKLEFIFSIKSENLSYANSTIIIMF